MAPVLLFKFAFIGILLYFKYIFSGFFLFHSSVYTKGAQTGGTGSGLFFLFFFFFFSGVLMVFKKNLKRQLAAAGYYGRVFSVFLSDRGNEYSGGFFGVWEGRRAAGGGRIYIYT